jgi:hypothetical protein
MEKWNEKPLSFSEILHVTFQIFKQHFFKIFILMLIITGFMYLVQWSILLSLRFYYPEPTESPWVESALEFEELFTTGIIAEWRNLGLVFLGLQVFLGITFLLSAQALVALAVDNIRRTKTVQISAIFKHVSSRFWALLGGASLYILLSLTLISGIGLIVGPYFWFERETSPFLPALAYLCGVIYFLIRWSFYFAIIMFEKVSLGYRESWNLTRGLNGRVIGFYIVFAILTFFISTVVQSVVNSLASGNMIGYLLNSLIAMASTMFYLIGYSVVYFDLRIRHGGQI